MTKATGAAATRFALPSRLLHWLMAPMVIAQLLIGAWMDRKYDPKIMASIPASVFYPIIYWMMMAIITFTYTLPALVRAPPKVQTWRIRRRLA